MLSSYIIQTGYDVDHQKYTSVKVNFITNHVYCRENIDDEWTLVENAVIVSPDDILSNIGNSKPVVFTRFSFSRLALP
jgi:hypothetical protein